MRERRQDQELSDLASAVTALADTVSALQALVQDLALGVQAAQQKADAAAAAGAPVAALQAEIQKLWQAVGSAAAHFHGEYAPIAHTHATSPSGGPFG